MNTILSYDFLLQANGGCFIKVGQHIGALDYLLPEEYVDTMKVLHNRAPQMHLRDVYKVQFRLQIKSDYHFFKCLFLDPFLLYDSYGLYIFISSSR